MEADQESGDVYIIMDKNWPDGGLRLRNPCNVTTPPQTDKQLDQNKDEASGLQSLPITALSVCFLMTWIKYD